jgi:ABC-type dipeptide/oligopeptide/nickel transport system permease component
MIAIIPLIGWIGAALMCAASFLIDTDLGKIFAIAGLSLLTLQAIDNKCYNLVFLNMISIGGYLYVFYS